MQSTRTLSNSILFDAGMFIGALLRGDTRHTEARPLVESARMGTLLKMLELAEKYHLAARRIHDARHAAMAIVSNVSQVYTYDVNDWKLFTPEGLSITGPNSILTSIP